MSFVQSQSLSKLACVTCKKYLSHFPIYLSNKGPVCGRCPKPNEDSAKRNVTYEDLAQFQKFPCSYNSNGCLEHLLPSNVPQHERFCYFRKYNCPTSCFTSCEWQGFARDLLEHFELKHPTFLLNEGRFEIDFINSHKENYLLPFGDDLFIVYRMTDSKVDTFTCSVSHIGSNTHSDDYMYKIILENGNKSKRHEITNRLKKETLITGDVIRNVLNDPISVIAHIEVFEQEDSKADQIENGEDEEEYNSEINFELLRELECLVCLEYMVPPIHQCTTGHSICLNCKNTVTECPACKQEFKNTQNFALAQIINHIVYPCKHEKCRFTAKAKDIKQHEATCIFGPFKCPLEDYLGCGKQMLFSETLEHIENNHYENLLEIDTINMPFDPEYEEASENDDEDCYIIKYASRLFKLHYAFKDLLFKWEMQLMGPAEESSKYKFEIDIVDNSGNNCRAYFKSICSPLSDKSKVFKEEGKYIFVDFDQIKRMITDEFTYRVRILQE